MYGKWLSMEYSHNMATFTNIAQVMTAINSAVLMMHVNSQSAIAENIKHLIAEINDRVSGSGVNSKGATFSPYSTRYANRKLKYGVPPKGTKIDQKNFYFKGNMWGNFGILLETVNADQTKVIIGFQGNNVYLSNDELNAIHSTKENMNIADPSEEEENKLVDNIVEAMVETLKAQLE